MDIVKIIQKCETWGDIERDDEWHFAVPVYFKNEQDARDFKVELMMVASGQRGYEKQTT